MAVENVNSKPIAASAAIADFILASIGGKLRQITEILARIDGVWEKTVDCDIYDLRHL